MVRAGNVCVAIIHRTLTWTTGSLSCARMLMHTTAHRGVRTHVRESALKVICGRKIPCRTWGWNLRQRHDGLMLYQGASSLPEERPKRSLLPCSLWINFDGVQTYQEVQRYKEWSKPALKQTQDHVLKLFEVHINLMDSDQLSRS